MDCRLLKKLGTILKVDARISSTNGADNKKTQDDASGRSSYHQ